MAAPTSAPRHTFTVFTSTRNRAHTLHRPFESLQAQTFRDFEWLIIDNGSTDGTPELVEAVDRGDLKVSVAANIATLSKEEQQAILANVDTREILQRAKEIRAAKAAENWAKWNARTIELSKASSPADM